MRRRQFVHIWVTLICQKIWNSVQFSSYVVESFMWISNSLYADVNNLTSGGGGWLYTWCLLNTRHQSHTLLINYTFRPFAHSRIRPIPRGWLAIANSDFNKQIWFDSANNWLLVIFESFKQKWSKKIKEVD